MKFSLQETGSGTGIHHVAINGRPLIVGRSLGADIFIDDPWISRHHCEITQTNGVLLVHDNMATNGTYVNGLLVHESHLYPGDRLRLGMTTFKIEYHREVAEGARTSETTWSGGAVGDGHASHAASPQNVANPLIG